MIDSKSQLHEKENIMNDEIHRYVESAYDLYYSGAIRFEQICEKLIVALDEDGVISSETSTLFQNILDFAQGRLEDEMIEKREI